MSKINPQKLPFVAGILINLGNIQRVKNEFDTAEQSYLEALTINRKLADVNSKNYLSGLVTNQINLAFFYQESKVDKAESLQFVDEAINYLLRFTHIPNLQNHFNSAFAVLKGWGIDVEKYWNEKLEIFNNQTKTPK